MANRLILALLLVLAPNIGSAQDIPNRKELKRGDLSGTGMEVVVSFTEYKPGDTIARHSHHGEEAV